MAATVKQVISQFLWVGCKLPAHWSMRVPHVEGAKGFTLANVGHLSMGDNPPLVSNRGARLGTLSSPGVPGRYLRSEFIRASSLEPVLQRSLETRQARGTD